MDNNVLVIGGGYAAALVRYHVDNSGCRVFSPNANLVRASEFESGFAYNKLLGEKAASWLISQIADVRKNVKLHNRIIAGGNSTIWGGFYDAANVDYGYNSLLGIGANLVKLALDKTGSISNCDTLHQLHDDAGSIYSSKSFLGNSENKFVVGLTLSNGGVKVDYYDIDRKIYLHDFFSKVYLCVGVVNAIGLLIKSFKIKKFSLIETPHSLRFANWDDEWMRGSVSIRYTLQRAVGHFLGVQKNYKNFSSHIPYCIEQNFSSLEPNQLEIVDGKFDVKTYKSANFGESIHYCNLKIEDEQVNNWIASYTDKIRFFGMAAVKQKNPGPISNDIHLDICQYFRERRSDNN